MAMENEKGTKKKTVITYMYKGKKCSIREIARSEKLDGNSLRRYLKQGYDIKQAVKLAKQNKRKAKESISSIDYHGDNLTYHAIASRVHVNAALLKTYHLKTGNIDSAVELAKIAKRKYEEKTKIYPYRGKQYSKRKIVKLEGLDEELLNQVLYTYFDMDKALMIASSWKRKKQVFEVSSLFLTLEQVSYLTNIPLLYLQSEVDDGIPVCSFFEESVLKLLESFHSRHYSIIPMWSGMITLDRPLVELITNDERPNPLLMDQWIEEKFGALFAYLSSVFGLPKEKFMSEIRENQAIDSILIQTIIERHLAVSKVEQIWLKDLCLTYFRLSGEPLEKFIARYHITNIEKKTLNYLEQQYSPLARFVLLNEFAHRFENLSVLELETMMQENKVTGEEKEFLFSYFYQPFKKIDQMPDSISHTNILNTLFLQYSSVSKETWNHLCHQYNVTIQEREKIEYFGSKMMKIVYGTDTNKKPFAA